MLNQDIINTIFSFVHIITSARNFARTCKSYYIMTQNIIRAFEQLYLSHNIYCHYRYWTDENIFYSHYCREKFTLELLHDECEHLVPIQYIHKDNPFISETLVKGGNIKMLQIAKERGCKFQDNIPKWTTDERVWKWAARMGIELSTYKKLDPDRFRTNESDEYKHETEFNIPWPSPLHNDAMQWCDRNWEVLENTQFAHLLQLTPDPYT